jgi:hypothetical protein
MKEEIEKTKDILVQNKAQRSSVYEAASHHADMKAKKKY